VKYNNDKSRDYTNPTLPNGDNTVMETLAALGVDSVAGNQLLPHQLSLLLSGVPNAAAGLPQARRQLTANADHGRLAGTVVVVVVVCTRPPTKSGDGGKRIGTDFFRPRELFLCVVENKPFVFSFFLFSGSVFHVGTQYYIDSSPVKNSRHFVNIGIYMHLFTVRPRSEGETIFFFCLILLLFFHIYIYIRTYTTRDRNKTLLTERLLLLLLLLSTRLINITVPRRNSPRRCSLRCVRVKNIFAPRASGNNHAIRVPRGTRIRK